MTTDKNEMFLTNYPQNSFHIMELYIYKYDKGGHRTMPMMFRISGTKDEYDIINPEEMALNIYNDIQKLLRDKYDVKNAQKLSSWH